MTHWIFLWQSEIADTTSLGYRVGYQIGSWLPFILIAGLMIALIIRSSRISRDRPE